MAASANTSSSASNQASAASLLARFLQYTAAALAANDQAEAAQLCVTRLRSVLPVDRAVLVKYGWRNQVMAVDSGADVVREARFANMVLRFAKQQRGKAEPQQLPGLKATQTADASDGMPAEGDPRDQDQREAMGGSTALWVPLSRSENDDATHGLWLERWQGKSWSDQEIGLVQRLGPYLNAALNQPKQRGPRFGRWLCLLIILCMFIPVRESVTASAQVVADQPRHVFAPFDGIIETVHVRPGLRVSEGDLLLRYDPRVLERQLEAARREVATARAELARLEGAAYGDQEARAGLPAQRLVIEQAQANQDWLAEQLRRTELHAPTDGMAIFDSADALIGAPVRVGESLLELADPRKSRVVLHVPYRDAGMAVAKAEVIITLDHDPFTRRSAVVTRAGFDVAISPDDQPSVRVEVDWLISPDATVRPGQHGTARIYGEHTVLGWQLFRKPWRKLAAILGW